MNLIVIIFPLSEATIYDDVFYNGASIRVQIGSCRNIFDFNDRASSIKTDACIRLWEHADCTGRRLDVNSPGDDNLVNDDFNDALTSVSDCRIGGVSGKYFNESYFESQLILQICEIWKKLGCERTRKMWFRKCVCMTIILGLLRWISGTCLGGDGVCEIILLNYICLVNLRNNGSKKIAELVENMYENLSIFGNISKKIV